MTVGNFLLGGPIGSVVDAANGSTRSLYPDSINAVLVADAPLAPVALPAPAAPPAAVVAPVPATPAAASPSEG
jgi:hypothetical protein